MSNVPVIVAAADLPAAIRIAERNKSSRWYVARRAQALGFADVIPAHWGVTAAGPSQAVRDKAADSGEAMPDGSFPIRNKADLGRAVQAYGRAKNKAAVKRFIIRRARALHAVDALPESWGVTAGALTAAAGWDEKLHPRDRQGEFIEHLGMVRLFGLGGSKSVLGGQAVGNRTDGKRMLVDVKLSNVHPGATWMGKPVKDGDVVTVNTRQLQAAPSPKATLELPSAPDDLGVVDLGTDTSAPESKYRIGDLHMAYDENDPPTNDNDYAAVMLSEADGVQESNEDEPDDQLEQLIEQVQANADDPQAAADAADELRDYMTGTGGYLDDSELPTRPEPAGAGGDISPEQAGNIVARFNEEYPGAGTATIDTVHSPGTPLLRVDSGDQSDYYTIGDNPDDPVFNPLPSGDAFKDAMGAGNEADVQGVDTSSDEYLNYEADVIHALKSEQGMTDADIQTLMEGDGGEQIASALEQGVSAADFADALAQDIEDVNAGQSVEDDIANIPSMTPGDLADYINDDFDNEHSISTALRNGDYGEALTLAGDELDAARNDSGPEDVARWEAIENAIAAMESAGQGGNEPLPQPGGEVKTFDQAMADKTLRPRGDIRTSSGIHIFDNDRDKGEQTGPDTLITLQDVSRNDPVQVRQDALTEAMGGDLFTKRAVVHVGDGVIALTGGNNTYQLFRPNPDGTLESLGEVDNHWRIGDPLPGGEVKTFEQSVADGTFRNRPDIRAMLGLHVFDNNSDKGTDTSDSDLITIEPVSGPSIITGKTETPTPVQVTQGALKDALGGDLFNEGTIMQAGDGLLVVSGKGSNQREIYRPNPDGSLEHVASTDVMWRIGDPLPGGSTGLPADHPDRIENLSDADLETNLADAQSELEELNANPSDAESSARATALESDIADYQDEISRRQAANALPPEGPNNVGPSELDVPEAPSGADVAPSAPSETPAGAKAPADHLRALRGAKNAPADAGTRLDAILAHPDKQQAHADLAKLMTESKLGGKQRKRYRELLDAHHGTTGGDSAQTQAATVADNLSPDNPLKDRLAAKAATPAVDPDRVSRVSEAASIGPVATRDILAEADKGPEGESLEDKIKRVGDAIGSRKAVKDVLTAEADLNEESGGPTPEAAAQAADNIAQSLDGAEVNVSGPDASDRLAAARAQFGTDSPQFEQALAEYGSSPVTDNFNFEDLGADSVGGYYNGRREMDSEERDRIDRMVLNTAKAMGMTTAELHDWADSKQGRYFADEISSGGDVGVSLGRYGPGTDTGFLARKALSGNMSKLDADRLLLKLRREGYRPGDPTFDAVKARSSTPGLTTNVTPAAMKEGGSGAFADLASAEVRPMGISNASGFSNNRVKAQVGTTEYTFEKGSDGKWHPINRSDYGNSTFNHGLPSTVDDPALAAKLDAALKRATDHNAKQDSAEKVKARDLSVGDTVLLTSGDEVKVTKVGPNGIELSNGGKAYSSSDMRRVAKAAPSANGQGTSVPAADWTDAEIRRESLVALRQIARNHTSASDQATRGAIQRYLEAWMSTGMDRASKMRAAQRMIEAKSKDLTKIREQYRKALDDMGLIIAPGGGLRVKGK